MTATIPTPAEAKKHAAKVRAAWDAYNAERKAFKERQARELAAFEQANQPAETIERADGLAALARMPEELRPALLAKEPPLEAFTALKRRELAYCLYGSPYSGTRWSTVGRTARKAYAEITGATLDDVTK